MQLTPHFSDEEFTVTEHRDIDNSLPPGLINEAIETCKMLERVREHLCQLEGCDVPLTLTSGYRCMKLNYAVGSKPDSDHPKARAADCNARTRFTTWELANALAASIDHLGIGQLIYEYGRWVHIGRSAPMNPINRIITYDDHGVRAGIVAIRP